MVEHDTVETLVRGACGSGDHATAATLVIEHYGGEILAFLIARLRDRASGEEVFAMFAEKLWVGLPAFEWRCSVRGWAYRLARNAANDFVASPHNRPRADLSSAEQARLTECIDRTRTATQNYQRTGVKDRMRELRETLPIDDQMLIVLRIDRGMSWRDLVVALGQEATLDAAERDKEAARLRKRFERIKQQLRELARDEGLL